MNRDSWHVVCQSSRAVLFDAILQVALNEMYGPCSVYFRIFITFTTSDPKKKTLRIKSQRRTSSVKYKQKGIDKYSSGRIEKSILLGKKYRPSQTVENEYTE